MSKQYMTEGQFKQYCKHMADEVARTVEMILPRFLPFYVDDYLRATRQKAVPIEEERTSMAITQGDLNKRFDHHPPPNQQVAQQHESLRKAAKNFALSIVTLVPEGREQSSALTKVEEAMMHGNAGIARHQ